MTNDFRYHVASLSAVFLALGIGILIGTAFVGTPVVNQQTAVMNRLNTNFAELSRETAELRKENRERELTEQLFQAAVPHLVKGTLAHRRVLLVQTEGGREAAEQAQKILEFAGATVERETLSEDNREALTARRNLPHLVVLAGGESEELAQSRDIPFLKALHDAGVRTVAVELYESEISLVPQWRGGADATVDCINRATGWLALVLALAGESGTLGLKPGATTPSLELLNRPSPTPTPEP